MFRLFALLGITILIVAGAYVAQPDQTFLASELVRAQLAPVLDDLVEGGETEPSIMVTFETQPDPAVLETVASLVADRPGLLLLGPEALLDEADHRLDLRLDVSEHSATLAYALDGGPSRVRRISWLSVLPPLLAIIAAIVLRRVVICLVLGILAGGVIAVWPSDVFPLWGVWHAFRTYFIDEAVLSLFNLQIITFVLLISAVVGVADAAGGIRGVIEIVVRYCRSARSARVGTAIAGLVLFFDDYLNCIVIGNAMRPLTDRYRVSREKLAYIVDSTAAPIAGLALVSTWIAYEISQIQLGIDAAGIAEEPFDVFIRSLPYRFYCMLTLVLVFCITWTGRDYGPMLAAERRAAAGGIAEDDDSGGDDAAGDGRPGKARYAIIPIGFTLLAIIAGLWFTGHRGLMADAGRPDTWLQYVQQVLGHAESARSFAVASSLGLLLTFVLIVGSGTLSFRQAAGGAIKSVRNILIAVVILFLAWTIGAACKDVGTADYLVAMFRRALDPIGFSLIVFGLSCLVAFSTGTSYGTMAILLPNVVPLALAVGENAPMGGMGLVTMSIGAVLEGAIFGDHCSPISDTTILSALSSRCDPIEHVRTQMPYALTGMAAAVVCGYVPVTLGLHPAICIALGAVVLVLVVRLVGRRADGERSSPPGGMGQQGSE